MTQPVVSEIDLCGARIRISRAGPPSERRGESLLVLRGDDASDDWRPYMSALSERFDVIAPEHPGFGGRAKPAWLDSVRDYANFYLDLLKALDLDRVHLMGHALGGWIAAELATRSTARLASLTLVAPFGVYEPDADDLDTFLRTEEQGLRDQFHDQAMAETEIARRLAPDTEDVRLHNQITIAQVSWTPRNYDPDLRKWLHRIDVPTLLVFGDDDRILPPPYGEAWAKLIPGARLEVIPNCGHAPQLERADDFTRRVETFLEQQRATV